jgi:hypothetical protein
VAACLPTLAVLTSKSHLSKISASAAHLLSLTLGRSKGGDGSNATASTPSVRKPRSDDAGYVELSEWSIAKGMNGNSTKIIHPIHQDNGDVSPFVTSTYTERGEGGEGRRSGIVVKKEVVQSFK